MWFESLLVYILFKFKKRPNIFGIWVVFYIVFPINVNGNSWWILMSEEMRLVKGYPNIKVFL